MKPFYIPALSHFFGRSIQHQAFIQTLPSPVTAFGISITTIRHNHKPFPTNSHTTIKRYNNIHTTTIMSLSESSPISSSSLDNNVDPQDETTNDNSDETIRNNNNLTSSISQPSQIKQSKPEPEPEPPIYTKLHTMTVCMVPSPEYKDAWEKITKARTELKDPGLFRWPPHVNMLYPFIDILNPKIIHNNNNNNNNNNDDDDTNNDGNDKDDDVKDEDEDEDKNRSDDDDNDDDDNKTKEEKEEDAILKTLDLLQNAIQKCQPFRISLDSFGTFGGNHRGVLFLNPTSFRCHSEDSSSVEQLEVKPDSQSFVSSSSIAMKNDGREEDITSSMPTVEQSSSPTIPPLIELQSILETHFPNCYDQRKNGKYTPHMTLSHFPSLEDALDAKKQLEQWWTSVEFDVNEVYVLKRVGDGGQFKILARLVLGEASQQLIQERKSTCSGTSDSDSDSDYNDQNQTKNIQVYDPPLAFPNMPTVEEDWVHEERMKLKERRNGKNGNRRRRSGRRKKKQIMDGRDSRRGPNRSKDTPEEIARKRAERAAKRERLAQEIVLLEEAIQGVDKIEE